MLKAYLLNPTSDRRRFTIFPPPECEVLSACPHEHAGIVMLYLCLFLHEKGGVRAIESDSSFPWPEAWQDLPEQKGFMSDLLLPKEQVAEIRQELDSFQLDVEAFRRYWINRLYGSDDCTPTSGDLAMADLGPELLSFLKQALDCAKEAEWLLVMW